MTFAKIKEFLVLLVSLLLSGCIGFTVDKQGSPEPGRYHLDMGTKEKTIALYGEPDRRVALDGGERWEYSESAFCGVMLYIVIPVPLKLPVCDKTRTITFNKEGDAESSTRRRIYSGNGFVCSPFLPMLSHSSEKGYCE